jgi:hypothetical protein
MRYLLTLLFTLTAFAQTTQEVYYIEVDGRPISYTIVDGFALTQGDIILGRADEIESYRAAQARGDRAPRPRSVYFPGTSNARLWPNATMYYTIEPDTPLQANLRAAIDYWNQVGPFKVLPRSAEPNYVTFQRIQSDSACNSSIGMVGGQQIIGVTTNCSVGSAIHEIGHAWGLLHEQERSDASARVTILFDNIDSRFWSNFVQSLSSVDRGYYDYDSIMHYPATGFSMNFGDSLATVPVGIPIGQRVALSAGDIDTISRIYGVIPTATTIATTPTGLRIVVDGETVTTPRRFEWAPGSQHSLSAERVQGARRATYSRDGRMVVTRHIQLPRRPTSRCSAPSSSGNTRSA